MPLKFAQPTPNHPLVKNFSSEVMESFRIGSARHLEFGYYFAVNGVWRWVSIVTSGDRFTISGHGASEDDAVDALNGLYRALIDSAGLTERRPPGRPRKAIPALQAEA